MIYLDHNTATPPCSSALERMQKGFEENWCSLAAPYRLAHDAKLSLQPRIQMLYDFIEAEERDQFSFTSSGSEAIHQVFWSVFTRIVREEGKCHIIISQASDVATRSIAARFEELGCTIKIAKLRDGQIDLEALEKMITPRTALISLPMADGVTGVLQPFEEVTDLAKKAQVLLHLDAGLVVGKLPITFTSDYMSFSGDLLHGPVGSGALFAKPHAPLEPFIMGRNLDAPSLLGLSAAVQQAEVYLDAMGLEVSRLKSFFEEQIEAEVLFQDQMRLPNTSLIRFEGVHNELLLYYLNRKGVFAKIPDPLSHRSMENAISFAMSRMTTEKEILEAASLINETYALLKPLGAQL